MNKIKTALILFVLGLFLFPAVLSFGIRYLPVEDQPPLGLTEKIYGNKSVEGKLLSPYNNINGVGLSFRNPNLQNKEEITLKLTKEKGGAVITTQLSGQIIPDGGFVRLMFEPIKDSKGVTYDFTLTSPSSTEEDALEVYLSRDSNTPASVLYYQPPAPGVLISDVFLGWIGRFWEDRTFAAFYLGIISIGFGYVVFGKEKTI